MREDKAECRDRDKALDKSLAIRLLPFSHSLLPFSHSLQFQQC